MTGTMIWVDWVRKREVPNPNELVYIPLPLRRVSFMSLTLTPAMITAMVASDAACRLANIYRATAVNCTY